MALLSFDKLRNLDIVDFLATRNIYPQKVKNNKYFYLSPIPGHRTDTTTFIVSRISNRWSETTSQQSGDILDLAVFFYSCTIGELSEKLQTACPSVSQPHISGNPLSTETIKIEHIGPIRSGCLDRYLWQRRISLNVTHFYCLEASYNREGRSYQSLAFRCDEGGYELYTPRHHYRVPCNSITHIKGQSPDLAIFQDVFDFLTFATILAIPISQFPDFLILNAPTPLSSMENLIRAYRHKYLFLPNTLAGATFSTLAVTNFEGCHDHRSLYRGYSTLNEWACHIGKHPHAHDLPGLSNGS